MVKNANKKNPTNNFNEGPIFFDGNVEFFIKRLFFYFRIFK